MSELPRAQWQYYYYLEVRQFINVPHLKATINSSNKKLCSSNLTIHLEHFYAVMLDSYQSRWNFEYFNGQLHIKGFLDWLVEVERIFSYYKEIAEEKKVKLIVHKLKDRASDWWHQLQFSSMRQGKAPIQTWQKMKWLMCWRFLPPDYNQAFFQQAQNCSQGSWTMRNNQHHTDFISGDSLSNFQHYHMSPKKIEIYKAK